MKVIVVGGYPGSGKSTIMKRVIKELEAQGQVFKENKLGIVSWIESKKVVILGWYKEGELFPGTDRLPMNVQPEAQRFLKSNEGNGKVVVLEGDRLFNEKMLEFIRSLKNVQLVLCIVTMTRGFLDDRRQKRSEQNATWRKGRETKVDRIAMSHPVQHAMTNDTEEDLEACAQELVQEINGTWKQVEVKSKIKSFWS
jgi:shikimate kinase